MQVSTAAPIQSQQNVIQFKSSNQITQQWGKSTTILLAETWFSQIGWVQCSVLSSTMWLHSGSTEHSKDVKLNIIISGRVYNSFWNVIYLNQKYTENLEVLAQLAPFLILFLRSFFLEQYCLKVIHILSSSHCTFWQTVQLQLKYT